MLSRLPHSSKHSSYFSFGSQTHTTENPVLQKTRVIYTHPAALSDPVAQPPVTES